jgi:hypothetical protein
MIRGNHHYYKLPCVIFVWAEASGDMTGSILRPTITFKVNSLNILFEFTVLHVD